MTKHRADLVSLFFGILFLAVAGWWSAAYYLNVTWIPDWNLPDSGWLAAGGLIVLGLIGILASLRRRPESPTVDAPIAPPPGGEGPE
jgi:hypothetical protein